MRFLIILVTYTIYCAQYISSESTTEPTPSTSKSSTIPPALYPEEEEILARIINLQEDTKRAWAENSEPWRRKFQEPRGQLGPVSEPLLPVPKSETQEQMIIRLRRDAENIYRQWTIAEDQLDRMVTGWNQVPCNEHDDGATEVNGRFFRSVLKYSPEPEVDSYCNIVQVLARNFGDISSRIAQFTEFPRTLEDYILWRLSG